MRQRTGLPHTGSSLTDTRIQGASHRTSPLSAGRAMRLSFAVALVLLLSIVAMTSRAITEHNVQHEWLLHTHQVMEALEVVSSRLIDAETGQRGFLLTHEEKYLEPYRSASLHIDDDLETVVRLTSDNPRQQERLAELRRLVNEKFQVINLTIGHVRSGQTSAALDVVRTNRGKHIMDGIRRLISDMLRAERELLHARAASAERSSTSLFRIVWGGSTVTLLFLGLALLQMSRYDAARRRTHEELRESEERFRAAVEAVSSLIWTNNAQGRMEGEQPGWGSFTGQTYDEYQGYGWAKAVHPEDAQPTIDAWNEAVARKQTFVFEHRVRRHDGAWRLCSIRAVPVVAGDGRIREWVGVHTDITESRQAEEALRRWSEELDLRVKERTREVVESQERLRALATELNLTEQRERKRLATDLHDHLAQMLVLGRLKLGQAKRLPGVDPQCADLIAQTEEVLSESLLYTRTLVADLSPPVLHEFGLAAALKWLAERMSSQALTVMLRVDGSERIRLPEDQAVLLFQSVRELIMNAIKHAKTEEVQVHLETPPGEIRIHVRDHGVGFAPGAGSLQDGQPESTKFGLFSIRERMKALNGHFTVSSAPGQGTMATLTLPMSGSIETVVHTPLVPQQNHAHHHHSKPEQDAAIRILLVDDHAMVRQGLRSLLESYPDVRVVGETCNGREAVALTDELRPSLVVMDINMPGMNGIEATEHIKARHPRTVVIGLSVQASEEVAEAMRNAGAEVLLTKEAVVDDLYQAIQEALAVDPQQTAG